MRAERQAVGIRAVIDTNVVFEGLTRRVSVPTLVIDAWLEELFEPCVSNALAYEYVDVLSRKLSGPRWNRAQPIVEELLARAEFIPVHFSWRPGSPDPSDDHVVDCGMNGRAVVVTSNVRDFTWARSELRLPVLTPGRFLWHLTGRRPGSPETDQE